MKQYLLKLFLMTSIICCQQPFVTAQIPDWNFVKNIPHANNNGGCFTATDGAGNFYLAGSFYSSITVGNNSLTSAGEDDIVVVKYDAAGNIIWARRAGGNGSDVLNKIAVDGNSNLYLTGSFDGSLTFANTTLSKSGYSDIFILKYDASGNEAWGKSAGGSDREAGQAVTTDNAGNVYVGGIFFSSSITFGSTTLNKTGSGNAFVVKCDASGNVVWAKSSSGSSEEGPHGICVDTTGNVIVTGYFSSTTATFDGITLKKSGTGTDMFVVKYDANGNVLWAKNSLGNHNSGEGFSVLTDISGNIFVTGGFNDGTVTFGNLSLNSVGGTDIFLVKFDPIGSTIWARSYGGSGHENGSSLYLDPCGNIYIGGIFASSDLVLGHSTLTSIGGGDVFLAKFDSLGNALWGKSIGSPNYDACYSIAGSITGDVFLAGSYSSPVTVSNTTLNEPGILVAKLNNCNVNAGADALVFFGSTSITQGLNCTTLTSSVPGGVADGSIFNWTSSPVSTIANNSSRQITVCPTVNTTYTVTYTVPGCGCIGSDDVLVKAIDVSCGNNNTKVKICITTPSGQRNTICVASSSIQTVLDNNPNAVLGDCSAYSARTTDIVSQEVRPNGISIYPNPAHNQILVRSRINASGMIRIFNTQGGLVYKKEFTSSNNPVQFNIENLKQGLYIVEVMQDSKIFRTKVVIQ